MPADQTPNSSASPYLTVDQFIGLKDVRALGQLALDNGQMATSAALQSNSRIDLVLGKASGEIESACFTGERYSANDLNGLTGVSQQLLQGLVADLAFYYLFKVRGASIPEHVVQEFDKAMESVQKLRDGERIFSFEQTEAAGLPFNQFLTPLDYSRLGLLSGLTRWAGRRIDRDKVIF